MSKYVIQLIVVTAVLGAGYYIYNDYKNDDLILSENQQRISMLRGEITALTVEANLHRGTISRLGHQLDSVNVENQRLVKSAKSLQKEYRLRYSAPIARLEDVSSDALPAAYEDLSVRAKDCEEAKDLCYGVLDSLQHQIKLNDEIKNAYDTLLAVHEKRFLKNDSLLAEEGVKYQKAIKKEKKKRMVWTGVGTLAGVVVGFILAVLAG